MRLSSRCLSLHAALLTFCFSLGCSRRLIALYTPLPLVFPRYRLLLREFLGSVFALSGAPILLCVYEGTAVILGIALITFVFLPSLVYFSEVIAAVRQRVFCMSVFLFCRVAYRYMRLSFLSLHSVRSLSLRCFECIHFAIRLPMLSSSIKVFILLRQF